MRSASMPPAPTGASSMSCGVIWRCPAIWTGEAALRFLDEHRRRPATLADHLPWAVRVAPGVVLNKDGSFLTALRFRGPDLESSTEDELMAVRARLNNALRRLGTGWCLHVDACRRPAHAYPASEMPAAAAWLVDAE